MLYALIAICGILSFLAVRSSYYPLKWAAGFGWWALLFYWIGADIVADGSPTDITVMLLLVMLGILFLLWGMAGRGGSVEVEDSYSSTGSLVNRIIKSTKTNNIRQATNRESTLEYRDRVRKALASSKRKKR